MRPRRARQSLRKIVSTVLVCLLVAAHVSRPRRAAGAAQSTADENALFRQRTSLERPTGSVPLQYDPWASSVANGWANWLAAIRRAATQPEPGRPASSRSVTPDWTRIGENVGFGPSVAVARDRVHELAAAPGEHPRSVQPGRHRRDTRRQRHVVGRRRLRPRAADRQLRPSRHVHIPRWYIRSTADTRAAECRVRLRASRPTSSCPATGTATARRAVGAYANGTWYLRNSNDPGAARRQSSHYGDAGYMPVVGDWNGDGIDTIGVYYQRLVVPPQLATRRGLPTSSSTTATRFY